MAAIDAIGKVSGIIEQINESQNAIASAVEEQSAMTSEISRNIAELTQGSGEINTCIESFVGIAEKTKQSTSDTIQAASNIEAMANQLSLLVGDSAISNRQTLSSEYATPL